jgi:hypothetical protein
MPPFLFDQAVFDDIGVPQRNGTIAAVAAQLFKCGLVVWWRTLSLLDRLECEVVPGGGCRLFLVPAN